MSDSNDMRTAVETMDPVDQKCDKVSIFISHKSKDRKTAEKIIEILRNNDNKKNPKMTFFISYDIPGGDRWYDTIRKNLKKSNLLLLLFTGSTRNWDWCLYEAGLFDPLDDESFKRVICLHNTTSIPDPLKHLQGFSATIEDMKKFLKQLFVTTELTDLPEPIYPQLENYEDQLEKQASKLSSLIQKGVAKTSWFSNYFFLEIKDPEKLDGKSIPPDAKVTADYRTLNGIFGLMDGEYSWQEIENVIPEDADKRWIQDLAGVIHAVSNKRLPDPIETTFPAVKGVKLYQPSLYRIDKKTDGSMLFKILFNEDISFRLHKVPADLAQLMISIIMATRLRFEILNEYLVDNKKLNINENFENTCFEIKQIIINIEKDASSRGLLDADKLADLFEEKSSRKSIKKMFADWYLMRENLMSAPESSNEKDVTQCLVKLMALNKEFLTMANYRYAELMA